MMLEAESPPLAPLQVAGNGLTHLEDHERGHVSEEAEVLQLRLIPPPPATEFQPCKTNYGV